METTDIERLARRIAALESAVLELIRIHGGGSGRHLPSFAADGLSRDIISACDDSTDDPGQKMSP